VSGLTPEACRQARATLIWTRERLAESADVSVATVRDFEIGRAIPRRSTIKAIRAALEFAGIKFVQESDGWLCVHFRV
jgi:ribosome-binding protein aMBF1 (putative translation factor)